MTKRRVGSNAIIIAEFIKALLEGPCTAQELADVSGLNRLTVYRYLKVMHRRKAIHLCAWEKDQRGRDITKVWALGPGKDKERERQPLSEKNRKTRERNKFKRIELVRTPCRDVVNEGALLDRTMLTAFAQEPA